MPLTRLEFAFRVGAVGCIVLTLFTLAAPTRVGLLALALWTYATLFVLPSVYDWYKGNYRVPWWFLRGPHQ